VLTAAAPPPSLVKSPELMMDVCALGILDTDYHDENLGDLTTIQ
jgi:hypothetical protein